MYGTMESNSRSLYAISLIELCGHQIKGITILHIIPVFGRAVTSVTPLQGLKFNVGILVHVNCMYQ